MKKKYSWIINLLFIIGILLLLTNTYGQFTSLRNPTLKEDINRINENDITISEDQIYASINSEFVDEKSYILKIAEAIHNGMGHYWEDEGIEKYNLRVPFQENYILFLAGVLMPDKFQKYEFIDYRRAIERGVGLCSQQSIILVEVLYEKGIKTKMVGLSGHVVATVQVDKISNEWWVFDLDYGVVIPYNIELIEKNPKIIDRYYSEKGYDTNTILVLEDIYGEDGNFISDGYGIGNYSLFRFYFEQASYILIWIIPILLIFPFLFYKTRKSK
ncbi:MAG: hypothetical protein ACYC59_12200 [Anaerolineaceae bacterium]